MTAATFLRAQVGRHCVVGCGFVCRRYHDGLAPWGLVGLVAVGDVIPVPLICIAVAMVLYVVSQKLQNRKLQNKAGAVYGQHAARSFLLP